MPQASRDRIELNPPKLPPRPEPNDNLEPITIRLGDLLDAEPCDAVFEFFKGRDLDEEISPNEIIDNFPVEATLWTFQLFDGVVEQSKIRAIAIAFNPGQPNFGTPYEMILDAYRTVYGQATTNAERRAVDELMKEKIILLFRKPKTPGGGNPNAGGRNK